MRTETMTETVQKPRWHELLARLSFLALMVWAVTTWITGYVFAPLMFAKWPKIEAGLITGELLQATYLISLICALLVLIDCRVRHAQKLLHNQNLWLTLIALFIVIIQYAVITPKMQALKANMLSNASAFMQLHGVSQVLYLITSLVLAVLVWRRLKLK